MNRRARSRYLVAAATLTLWILAFAAGTPAQNRPADGSDYPDMDLPAPARGAAALAALAAHVPEVAGRYGKSPDELRGIMLRDDTLWADRKGRLFYGCEFGQAPRHAASVREWGEVFAAPYPTNQTFLLHSRPGATKVVYLDFDGHVTSGTLWNTNYTGGADIVSAPYDVDGVPGSFNATELENIQYMWQRVAEDFAPFDVDVTTQDPGVEGLRKTSANDASYGIRVVVSPTNWYSTNAGGVAYIGSFNWNTDTPCWVFTLQLANGEKYIAEAASHEVGHTVGLHHDGVTGGASYYSGHGEWAPIMGVGYYEPIVQWSKGEYTAANNTEDDLAIIATYVPYRADDHGNFIGSATPLAGANLSGSGIIENRNDVDMFSFQTGAGPISLTVNPGPRGPNLDLLVSLYDGGGNLVASNNGTGLPAALAVTVTAGTYYLSIDGVGTGDPTTGYSDYGSLGQYQITGTVVPNGNQAPTATAGATPSSGTAPLAVGFSSAGSSDPDGTIQSYHWDFNDGGSSSSPNPSHSFAAAGTYTVTLVVTDNGGLSDSDTVVVTVTAPNQAPVAQASANPTSGTAPLAVAFSSAGSSDPDGTIQSYGWAFGDGGSSSAANPSHTYTAAGTYVAVLTVTDNLGAQATSSVSIGVQPVPAVPDLAVSASSASPGSAAAGTAVTVTDTTNNQGTGQAAASTTSVYYSSDSIFDAGDLLLGSRSVGQLTSGASSPGSTTVTIPASATPGTRYLIIRADNGLSVTESNEGNNTRAQSITITAADLQVSSLSAPSSAARGASVSVTDTTRNIGSGTSPATTTHYYLSPNNSYSSGDILLGSRTVGTLAGGASSTGGATLTVPAGTAPGSYYIIAYADGGSAVNELKETNNTRSSKFSVR